MRMLTIVLSLGLGLITLSPTTATAGQPDVTTQSTIPRYVQLWENVWARGTFFNFALPSSGGNPDGFRSQITGRTYSVANREMNRLIPRDQYGQTVRFDERTRYLIEGLRQGDTLYIQRVTRLR